ncbi:hypothetical protein [Persicirhabdus sediminis]|uniref:Uncharacterized protein n=1 Tax=Persicirhabdus sediminis TaxID=454144 RepID=A0A8J7MB68_9BACT|nr:hypothetical protein [Persicirhabdus sediminis]MBK1790314.1 hypothetical protein [Persicirhabdus sediminis]
MQKVRLFIIGSALVLSLWLGASYMHEVDYQTYPRLGKGSLPLKGDLSGAVIEGKMSPAGEDLQSASR